MKDLVSFFNKKDDEITTVALIQQEFFVLAKAEGLLLKKILHLAKGAEPEELIQQLKDKHELIVKEMDKLADRLTAAEEQKTETKEARK